MNMSWGVLGSVVCGIVLVRWKCISFGVALGAVLRLVVVSVMCFLVVVLDLKLGWYVRTYLCMGVVGPKIPFLG